MGRDIRTVISHLVNGTQQKYETVYMNEALMMHAGVVGFVSALADCVNIVLLLGDRNRVPFIDRDNVCVTKYDSFYKFCRISRDLVKSYRCPMDVLYSLDSYYGGKACTVNKVIRSLKLLRYSGARIPHLEGTLYLVHFQADKYFFIREIRHEKLGLKVVTIHEAQGLTWKKVVCV